MVQLFGAVRYALGLGFDRSWLLTRIWIRLNRLISLTHEFLMAAAEFWRTIFFFGTTFYFWLFLRGRSRSLKVFKGHNFSPKRCGNIHETLDTIFLPVDSLQCSKNIFFTSRSSSMTAFDSAFLLPFSLLSTSTSKPLLLQAFVWSSERSKYTTIHHESKRKMSNWQTLTSWSLFFNLYSIQTAILNLNNYWKFSAEPLHS